MNQQIYIPSQNLIIPSNRKTILVGGCFDILHFGHFQFLEKAKAMGNYLIVALEPDERIIHYKNRYPIHNQEKRALNLLGLRFVDHIIMLPLLKDFDDYLALVAAIKPNIIAVTSDDPQIDNKQKQADAVGAQLVIAIDRIEPFSSSKIYRNG